MSVACFAKHFLRCAVFNPTPTRTRALNATLSYPALRYITHCSAGQTAFHRWRKDFHTTSASPTIAKLLSADELFYRKSLHDHLKTLVTEYSECVRAAELRSDEQEVRLRSSRLTALGPVVQKIQQLDSRQRDLEETEALLKENDRDLRALAETEREQCLTAIQDIKQTILSLLVPDEEWDLSDLVLEVTAGVGGQEAMLFTAEIFAMYQNYAAFHGWRFDMLEYMPSDLGGLRHASASISGPLSYKKMKFEAGVHRVQRVPKTEKQGRMHTSTMTVAILPQPAEISFTINLKDLRIETKRASGAGGQHVNTTDSAVRIVHLPTGTVSECQQERSQIKNKEKAMKMLRAKLYSAKLEEETSKRYQARKLQIGTKGRSEKIRTYNFAQDRITDHRIGKTLHDIHGFLLGEELLDEMSTFLQRFSEQEALMELIEEH
ncbi:Peptide chain release factor 1-like, mitochondrial [Bagarius yarrelli]|uniref:Peptide chain release factor 1-like, mitochondrial n=1 Tax=Bagarius yarrelli TaxID=175774 RepID=A0A556U720_BAGYA|nr:Peptide chain release factor 1-like, mitochondrial [Bagarius yarrelli]